MPSTVDTGREDPLVSFNFMLEIQGVISGYFTEVSGIGSETETVEQKVITEKGVQVVLKVPGPKKLPAPPPNLMGMISVWKNWSSFTNTSFETSNKNRSGFFT